MHLSNLIYQIILPIKDRIQSNRIINYYANSPESWDKDLVEMINYIKKVRQVRALNYPFAEKYKNMSVKIGWDKLENRFYCCHKNKKMYFSSTFRSRKEAAECYRLIAAEQDKDSPHRYLSKTFRVDNGSIVVDAGVAEGNFSIEVLPYAEKLILVESDPAWIEALKVTFRDEIRAGKVVFVEKFLGEHDDEHTITLDTLYKKYGKIDFVKMDIEGSEQAALRGAKRMLADSKMLKMAVCTYHTPEAFIEVCNILGGGNFELRHTRRYMVLNPILGWKAPYARRGIVRAVKKDNRR